MIIGGLALAFLAGILTVLSPCVLPLLPIVFATAANQHRLGPLALAGGLAISFTALGLFIATIGFAIGLDADAFRLPAAILFVAIGVVLAVPAFEARFALAAGPVGDWTGRRFGGVGGNGAGGPFMLGLLLGAVWVPCVGPTVGAASLIAARGEQLAAVAATLLVFGIGAALPLVILGLVSRQVLLAWRARLADAGHGLRVALGALLVAIGLLTLTGYDKAIETALVEASPDWLTELTTRY